jgi:hypothetical protein
MLRFILTVILTILTASMSFATDRGVAESTRPFWTEQSSFTIGDALYAIGIATNAASVEEGRQAAFANGLGEIRNYYGPVSNLDNVLIETQMTYEEPQADGRVSVWRLLQVSLDSLRMVKATKTHQALASQQGTAEVRSTEPPRVAAVTTRQTRINHEIPLPTIPLRYPQIISGWTQDDTAG